MMKEKFSEARHQGADRLVVLFEKNTENINRLINGIHWGFKDSVNIQYLELMKKSNASGGSEVVAITRQEWESGYFIGKIKAWHEL